jgi:NADP-dependent aldehyde dehydrogenase
MTLPRDILIAGRWRPAVASATFQATDPASGQALEDIYPQSHRKDIVAALHAGREAAKALLETAPSQIADSLDAYAASIADHAEEIVRTAHRETALPVKPRLADVELPRTVGQLRQAAAAARDGSWRLPVIDAKANIRSFYAPLGAPVAVFGPNNFPLAFNSVSGGDFAAALAAGNPVIAKAHTSHPSTSRLLAELAFKAVRDAGLPEATVQLLYRTSHEDGKYLVSHPEIGATAYTGSRAAGLVLKSAADAAGKPIYLELSSVNPVVILPGALRERADEVVAEFVSSALLGSGQFCTNPGLVLVLAGAESERFIAEVGRRFAQAEPGPLLSAGVALNLTESVQLLRESGAELVTGGAAVRGEGFRYQNTLLRVGGAQFLRDPYGLQREAFGNCSVVVTASDTDELRRVVEMLEGSLTGSIYSSRAGADDGIYEGIARLLRQQVGRLLNDKMPTGVAVSPAMNHGGPFPATGHPGFTAVGIPASMRRFAMLQCYDGVREPRLPPELRNQNPTGRLWRSIDGVWTQGDVES